MKNTIEIRAVRAKDWRWWYVQLTGVDSRIIAGGSGTIGYIGAHYHEITASSNRNLRRKLYARLGVKKLDWEVKDE